MATKEAFVNPIIPGFNPDPSICRVGEDFFLVTSSFEYFPGIPIYHSKDLLDWKLIGHLFFDDDGKVYFSAVNQIRDPEIPKHGLGLATFTTEIDLKTGNCLGPVKWNRISTSGIGIAEGPHIFKKDGYYYLTTAEGGTDEGHQQWIHRSTVGPFGPWEGPEKDANPILFNDIDLQVRNTGHLDFIETVDGRWWAVFLGVRPQGDKAQFKSQLGRETFLAPVQWIDGWPIVNGRKNISLEIEAPGMRQLAHPQSWRDTFEGPELQLGWYHLRTPLKKAYAFDPHQSSLLLYGGAYSIWDSECSSMLLQKQVHFSLDWRVEINFLPTYVEEEAGTAIWWSQFAYASIGIRKKSSSEGREVICRYLDENNEFQVRTS
ncbi:hypothetical protein G7Z17_g5857 [Cylindrodendrum hubeiense]|uniref:Beta-xylosidase C-terminal Concanavalin A-like domain-containing protein n=1 Tax=Cylindrodendrum hubeiense TaxID=595255 RepID=A0A9P5H6B8_9HYPO|nr:hypothetical protein G7Z17_g5857 [Cylindrodendrum hubeiense]